jgi:hypothetical protein
MDPAIEGVGFSGRETPPGNALVVDSDRDHASGLARCWLAGHFGNRWIEGSAASQQCRSGAHHLGLVRSHAVFSRPTPQSPPGRRRRTGLATRRTDVHHGPQRVPLRVPCRTPLGMPAWDRHRPRWSEAGCRRVAVHRRRRRIGPAPDRSPVATVRRRLRSCRRGQHRPARGGVHFHRPRRQP